MAGQGRHVIYLEADENGSLRQRAERSEHVHVVFHVRYRSPHAGGGGHAQRRTCCSPCLADVFMSKKKRNPNPRTGNKRAAQTTRHACGGQLREKTANRRTDRRRKGTPHVRTYIACFETRSQKVKSSLGDRLFKQPPTTCGLACSRQTVHGTTRAAHDEQSQRLNNHPDAARRRQADDAKTRDLISCRGGGDTGRTAESPDNRGQREKVARDPGLRNEKHAKNVYIAYRHTRC